MIGAILRPGIALAQRLADSDCEEFHDGLVAQPVNTVTSLAYVLPAVWFIWKRPRRRASMRLVVGFAVAVAFIGIGSVAFHGPQGWGARWLHDVPIVVAIAAIPAWNLARLGRIGYKGAFAGWSVVSMIAGLVAAVSPDATLVLGVVLGVAAVVTEVMVRRSWRAWAPALIVGVVGTVLNLLGRTDAPLCEPDSVLQLHGVWHLLTAVAIFLWGRAAFAEQTRSATSDAAT
ncbi:MAG: ceramidase domain-containing protein [Acidimicrobiales bacterium]